MLKQLKTAVMMVMVLAIAGCSSAQVDPASVAGENYGPYPDDYQETVKAYFQEHLKDPYTAQYRFKMPYKAYLRDAPVSGGKPIVFGYVVECGVNAKNSYGAYIGEKVYTLFLRNGVAAPITPNPWFQERWYQ
ncbi:hypothetical protein NTD80_13215 [Pseudomonas sp. 13B_2.1_Bac1]|jgi:hypothetical protein|uniref:hypothetical protein n=1 Tax=Pseudomonas sp. 13B_2.1_Bac1 TaxID=2971624 RepID=UPI0021CA478E|nr:hypothetical protein [Pseudomonas sp. 13B_2.1_Bac1]MCU1783717.1 hypothetical protein [Pseudomonas sp. 13B_2.1_Bac1]